MNDQPQKEVESDKILTAEDAKKRLGRGLLDSDLRPMSEEECEVFFHISIHRHKLPDDLWRQLREVFEVKLAIKRFECTGEPYDQALLVLFIQLCDTPAKVVMWCYTIHVLQSELGRVATIDDIATGPFATGVPTGEAYDELWERQKSQYGNTIDAMHLWPAANARVGEVEE